MSWNHLYNPGGLGNQDPMLLYYFDVLHKEKARAERERNEKHQKEMEAKSRQRGGRVAGRRR